MGFDQNTHWACCTQENVKEQLCISHVVSLADNACCHAAIWKTAAVNWSAIEGQVRACEGQSHGQAC